MLSQKQDTTCFGCHDTLEKGLKAADSKHAPVMAGNCTKCHSPHKSKLARLLLAQVPDLCVNCHKPIKDKLAKENPHPPAQKNCQECHKPHFASVRPLLPSQPTEVCSQCHDLKAASFAKAHLNIAVGNIKCMSCHDPHASKDPKFFKETIHPPFAARSCEDCHIVGKQ